MADTPHIADTLPQDWKYISEGGSTIVFSYAGPPHPAFDGTALRLRKGPISDTDTEAERHHHQPQLVEDSDSAAGGEGAGEEEADDPTIVFQRTVIERLVPPEHLPKLDAVRVERAWLGELAARTEPQRPQERRSKDRIDVDRKKAVLATDLVGGAGWAVEIKPKWGFLPAAAHLSPETRAIKTRTCRFCMHAHLKAAQGEDVSLGYCPLDLFAQDDPARVAAALRTLWRVWLETGAAVNNLRVFVAGRMIKPSGDPASLSPLADQLFPPSADVPSPPAGAPPVHTPEEMCEAFMGALLPLLTDTPVLGTLSRLQRTLDALDVEGLSALWARVRPARADALGEGEEDPDMGEWTRFVDRFLARGGVECETAAAAAGEEEEELRFRLVAYLLSASFKDCSVIVRMRPGCAGTVSVIDLDVKRMERLGRWARLDGEIVDAYGGVDVRRACVDGAAEDRAV